MSKVVVFYHGPECMDGLGAAAVLYSVYGNSAEYHPLQFGDELPYHIDIKDAIVYFLDVCVDVKHMQEYVLTEAASVVVIDHHKGTIDKYRDITDPKLDMSSCSVEFSGAMLTWNKFNKAGAPPIISYIQDRDLWTFKYTYTKAYTAYLRYNIKSPFEMFKLFESNPVKTNKIIDEGGIICNTEYKLCMNLISENKRQINIINPLGESESWVMINAPAALSSDIGNIVAVDYPFVAIYSDSNKFRRFSLRSSPSFSGWRDVNEIAKQYGGGGHKNAAGFRVDRKHMLAMI